MRLHARKAGFTPSADRNMKVYRSCWCDFWHTWEVYVDEDAPETEADVTCPHGHEAVACTTEVPANLVRLTILPAARIIGEGNLQRLYGERKFHMSISDREGVLLRTSTAGLHVPRCRQHRRAVDQQDGCRNLRLLGPHQAVISGPT